MMRRAGHSRRRSIGVGLALFGLFFQLFLPISLAAAMGPGGSDRILEICSADGFVRVPLPAGGETGSAETDADHVEACNHCVLHAANFLLPARIADQSAYAEAAGVRVAFPNAEQIRKSAPGEGFDARGPPMRVPVPGRQA